MGLDRVVILLINISDMSVAVGSGDDTTLTHQAMARTTYGHHRHTNQWAFSSREDRCGLSNGEGTGEE